MTRRPSALATFKTVYPYGSEAPLDVVQNWITCGDKTTTHAELADVFLTWTDAQLADEILAAWKFNTTPERADLIAAAAAFRAREAE